MSLSHKGRRTKGIAFEHDVREAFEAAGFTVRGLEGTGDHLIISRDGIVLASECKRQEKPQWSWWWQQATQDAPAGTIPVLTAKANRQPARVMLYLDDLLRLVGNA